MTHPKQDIKLVEILQASCLYGDDPLRSLLVHMVQRVPEEELTAFLNAESYSRTEHRTGYTEIINSIIIVWIVNRDI